MAAVVQVQQFTITVPAGTTVAAPQTTQTQLGDGWRVEWLEVRMPPGPRGQVGLYVASSGQQVIPFTTGTAHQWLVLDGEKERFEVTGQPNSGDWQVVAYNTGNFPHTFWVRFGVNLVPDTRTLAPVLLLPSSALSAN